ncbi:MAG: hypothetical protein QG549_514 [Patescibacteria group bacterium]|nr:hypothetical protein [Patescibacteria group bacterium]
MKHRASTVQRHSAMVLVSTGQIVVLLVLLAGAGYLALQWPLLAQVATWCMITFFFVFVGLKVVLWRMSFLYEYAEYDVPLVSHPDLPRYVVLAPIFQEEQSLKGLIRAMERLAYPKEKLTVLLLLESRERDQATYDAVMAMQESMSLPSFVEVLHVPNIKPFGKPKPLNYGYQRAKELGAEFVTVYDAEDQPDPMQLLKAVGKFWASDDKLGCLQCRLNFANASSSIVTRIMWAEYYIHFKWMLPGMQKLGLTQPLGGTSNHFRMSALERVSFKKGSFHDSFEGPWDPYNVTEDADLGAVLRKFGYRTEMLDSVTEEIAPDTVWMALQQRSRWQKGYIQTVLVFLRQPIRTARAMGPIRWFIFVLFVGGTPLSIVTSTLSWLLTLTYFITRSHFIELLFPPVLLYTGTFILVFGNLAILFQHLIATVEGEHYSLTKWMFFSFIWQQLTTISVVIAANQLMRKSTRYSWFATPHENDLHVRDELEEKSGVSSFQEAHATKHPELRIAPAMQDELDMDEDIA